MPYIVTENCIMCKHTNCVDVCPVDCFHEGPNFVVIDPNECIDCGLCEPECPAKAITQFDERDPALHKYATLNRELSQAWPSITERKDALPDAKGWHGTPNKLELLQR